jgi:hypothetical protein
MAHYAFIDDDNKVIEVIAGTDENILIDGLDTETWYSNYRGVKCVRTSYNGNIRKNYAGVGYTYDPDRDAFISPKPDTAIGFDEETCQWIVPEVIDEAQTI